MSILQRFMSALRRDQRGMTTVEYVIALCLVAAVGVGLWTKFGETVKGSLGGAEEAIRKENKDALDAADKTKFKKLGG